MNIQYQDRLRMVLAAKSGTSCAAITKSLREVL